MNAWLSLNSGPILVESSVMMDLLRTPFFHRLLSPIDHVWNIEG